MACLPGPIELCDDSKTDTVDPAECSRKEKNNIEVIDTKKLRKNLIIIKITLKRKIIIL